MASGDGIVGLGAKEPRQGGSVVDQLRLGNSLEQIIGDAHGRYSEAGRLGRVHTVTTAVAGTTVVAGNVSPVAAAAASILSLWNPTGSGMELSILRVILAFISGTPGAGPWVLNGAGGQVITATENAAPVCHRSGFARSVAKGFTQTALTGSGLQALLRFIGGAVLFAGAIAATTPGQGVQDELAGDVHVPEGGLLSIAAPAVGTTLIVAAAITFEEIPIVK